MEARPGIVDAVRSYFNSLHVEHSIDWALAQWKPTANRPDQTVDDAEKYIADFKSCTHVRALAGVRRPHLLAWRAELEVRGTPAASTPELRKARKLGPKSINHRLELVSAILRTGWRDAEIHLVPDLSKINLPEGENDRGVWPKDELLKGPRSVGARIGAGVGLHDRADYEHLDR